MSDKDDDIKKFNRRRKSLFLSEEVKAILRNFSIEYGVPESQIVSFLIIAAEGNLDRTVLSVLPRYLVPSRSPAWQNDIDLERFKQDLNL